MKKLALVAIAAGLLPSALLAASGLPDCKISVYALDAKHSSLGRRFLGPNDVVSVARVEIAVPGMVGWEVQLTDAGASANTDFSSKNIGKQIAILCDGKGVSRPTIEGASTSTFIFTVPQ
jgi:preprotein translocase subunit SecD